MARMAICLIFNGPFMWAHWAFLFAPYSAYYFGSIISSIIFERIPIFSYFPLVQKQKRTPVKPDKDESESGDDADDKKATSSDDEPHKRREEKQVEKSESGSGEEEQDDTSPEEKVSVKKKTGKGRSGVSPSKKGRSKEKQEKSKESEPRSSTTGTWWVCMLWIWVSRIVRC